jgi:hypothetical protein
MVFLFFFPALELFSSQLRDVWDEIVSKSINSNEKTALKLPIRVASPKIVVRNFCIFFQNEPESICGPQLIIAVRNFCMGMILTWFLRVNLTHLDPSIISHVNIFVYTQWPAK